MILRFTILFLLLLSVFDLDAQISSDRLNESEKKVFKNIISLSKQLKSTKTPNYNSLQLDTSARNIYDELLNNYYDLSYLKDSIKDAKNSLNQRMALQKIFLYNADHYLDVLPSDSIYVYPIRLTELRDQVSHYPVNSFVIYFLIENKPFYHTVLLFSDEGKLYFISPLIHFEKNHSEEAVTSFFKRHGLSKIESKLIQL